MIRLVFAWIFLLSTVSHFRADPPSERAAQPVAPVAQPGEPSPPGELIDDPKRGFRVTLPPGFVPMPGISEQLPNFAHTYGTPLAPGSTDMFIFSVEDVKGTVPQWRVRTSDVPELKNGLVSSADWQGYEINVFEAEEAANDFKTYTYKAQIPLRQGAILMVVVGPAHRREETRQYFTQILGSLQGETNWSQKGKLAERPHPLLSPGAFFPTLLVVAIVLGVAMWLIVRYTQRGVGLVIGVLLWGAGNSLAQDSGVMANWTGGISIAGGILKMAGSLAFVMGIIEYFIPRPPEQPPSGEVVAPVAAAGESVEVKGAPPPPSSPPVV